MTVKCFNCGQETTLVQKSVGKFRDDAYGIPKWFEYFMDVTECCKVEDFEEIEAMLEH